MESQQGQTDRNHGKGKKNCIFDTMRGAVEYYCLQKNAASTYTHTVVLSYVAKVEQKWVWNLYEKHPTL